MFPEGLAESRLTVLAIIGTLQCGRPWAYDYVHYSEHNKSLAVGWLKSTLKSGRLQEIVDSYEFWHAYNSSYDLCDLIQSKEIINNRGAIEDFRYYFPIAVYEDDEGVIKEAQFDAMGGSYNEAELWCEFLKIDDPLAFLVIFDSCVSRLDNSCPNDVFWEIYKKMEEHPGELDLVNGGDLKPTGTRRPWIKEYFSVHKDLVFEHYPELIPRINIIQQLIDEDRWDLSLPIKIHEIEINHAIINSY